MKKVLIITYYWPPSGGAGVQRWLKFVKYLPEFGLQPVVLTIDPANATYPVIDDTLINDVQDDLIVHHASGFNPLELAAKIFGRKNLAQGGFSGVNKKSLKLRVLRFIRGNLFIPDPRYGWNKNAFRKAAELIKEHKIEVVITSSPPHSTQLIGLKLKRRIGIKWIADLRDPWMDIYYYADLSRTYFAKLKDKSLEKRVLREADEVLTVGNHLKTLFENKGAKRVRVVTNGYDKSDFQGLGDKKWFDPNKINIVYAGTMSDVYNPAAFFSVVKQMGDDGRNFHMHFFGSQTDKLRSEAIDAFGDRCTFHEYINHADLPGVYMCADVLLLVIPDQKHDKVILTGKLFEYIAARKPILGIGPKDGDAAQVVARCDSGRFFNRSDEAQMKTFLQQVVQKELSLKFNDIEAYERKFLTEQLAEIIKGDT